MKYVYDVPLNTEINVEHKQIGILFGKVRIVTNQEIPEFSRYLVRVEEEVEENKEEKKIYTKDELESMKYKELQEIAKSMGIKYKGKKTELIDRILSNQ